MEHPVLAPHGLRAQSPLDVVGVQGNGSVLQADLELGPPGQGIIGGLQEKVGWKQPPPVDLLAQEVEELLHDRPGVFLADFEQSLRISPAKPFHQVEPSNPVQDLLDPSWFEPLGLDELPAGMAPALDRGDLSTTLRRCCFVDDVTVRYQFPLETFEDLVDNLLGTGGREQESNLRLLSEQRPEIAGLHLILPPTSPGRGLIHRQDFALQHGGEHGVIDRLEQLTDTMDLPGQSPPVQVDPGLLKALVLPIERQMKLELVLDQASQEADVRRAALDDGIGSRGAGNRPGLPDKAALPGFQWSSPAASRSSPLAGSAALKA
jgi:hypothetical protein